MMTFASLAPPSALADAVKTVWLARGTKDDFAEAEPIVPDGCVEIILNLSDPFVDAASGRLQPRALLAGQMTRPVVALPTGDVDLLGVRFWTTRAGAALRVPMWTLRNQLIAAGSIVPPIERLTDDLRNMTDGARIAHLTGALRRLLHPIEADRLRPVDHALALIDRTHGATAIESIARYVGITRRHLERRFHDEVGLRAKDVSRIARIQHVLRLMAERPGLGGAEIAADCGYSDQAHLIRECRSLTGNTFARLEASSSSLARLMRRRGN